MASILEKIVEQTTSDLKKRKRKVAISDFSGFELYEADRKPFADRLRSDGAPNIIAEIKKASPSKGLIRSDFDPVEIAEAYQKGGAAAISVLTDTPFFQGDLDYLADVRKTVDLSLLRKDFIVDPYQIKEARAYGADAVLLIATITDGNQLQELQHAAKEVGVTALIECYHAEEIQLIDMDLAEVIGVNNRDLHTFTVDLHRSIDVLTTLDPEIVTVSESGINSVKDLEILKKHGIDAALIGEYFMRQPKPGEAVRELAEAFTNKNLEL